MPKYWNDRRLKRTKERRGREWERAARRSRETIEHARSYTARHPEKNARLMLEALAVAIRRKMIARLARGGAMSLTKLSEPFNIALPSAIVQMRVLERSGIVATRKQGRTRICFLRRGAFQELARFLADKDALLSLE